MEQMEQKEQKGLGNTSSKPPPKKSRRYALTLNNWTKEEMEHMTSYIIKCKNWIIGKEVGENNTPHLQCYMEFKNTISFKSIKKSFPRCHIEIAKGNLKQNYEYCSKDGDFKTNIDMRSNDQKIKDSVLEDEYKNVIWKDWQQEIINILDGPIDKRKIYWFWENTGNVGKSYLCKYLALTRNIIICEGKRNDIFNQVLVEYQKGVPPTIVLCDIPRTSIEYINWGAIEKLKNGCLYSGKYEGGQCIFKIPHVICFANSLPDTSALSADRWEIMEIQ